jgi:hypothetical protein
VAVEKNVVIPPLSLVVEAGTNVGPDKPPPPTIILVEVPVMIVVVSPLTIVVINSDEMIGEAVGGCCTIV